MMTTFKTLALAAVVATLATTLASPAAQAGVFNLSHFVNPGNFSIGVEPELTMTTGASLGANLKYTHGINDLLNVTGVLGTGGGSRRFRVGGATTFDFFPDIEGQPGIGIVAQGIYYRLPNQGLAELTAIPYVHKSFYTKGGEFEPFVAFPVGFAFTSSEAMTVATLTLGSMFKASEQLRYVMEIGVAVANSESYFSGGLVYYH